MQFRILLPTLFTVGQTISTDSVTGAFPDEPNSLREGITGDSLIYTNKENAFQVRLNFF